MSNVSFMEKLLDGVEVEWKALGDVVNFQRGKRLVKSQLEEVGKFAVYQNSMTPLGYYHESNVEAESAFVICAGAAGEIGYSKDEIWAADDVHFAVTPEIVNSRYLYHFLLTQKNKITGQVRRASIPRLSKTVLEKLNLPIPCPNNPKKSLEIQAEIVRILDAFTAMTAELTAELNLRKKQYNYYRDQLLSFEEGEVEWKMLGEITRISSASRVHKNEWTTSGVPFFRTSDVISLFNGVKNSREDAFISSELYEKLSLKSGKLQKDDILVTGGGTIGIPYIVPTDEPLYFKDADLLCIKKSKPLNSKFLYHYFLTTKFRIYLENISHNSTIAHYTISQITKTPVPVPPLAEQARIVTILDKFDALTNSITEGLPREIELRQKQYEYYRDLLLSFPEFPSSGGVPEGRGGKEVSA